MPAPTYHHRLGCSTISFRHQDLAGALATIAGLGFAEIDLGALPGVCDHVPYLLDDAAVRTVASTVANSGLKVRSINADIGDLNVPLDRAARARRDGHLDTLLALAATIGAQALVLPCGAPGLRPVATLAADLDRVAAELVAASHRAAQRGVQLWAETLHFHRLCCNLHRAQQLTDRIAGRVGVVMDFSHVHASGGDPVDFVDRFGPHIAHVHIRDALPGNINVSVGNGRVDFARGLKALADNGYSGHFALELETRDITDDERPAAAASAGHLISALI
jgi:sugar phosphate isomerase/epimerase